MKKRIIIDICVIFLLIVCIYSISRIYQKYNTKKSIEQITNTKVTPDNNSIINLRKKYHNDDIVGILSIASINTILVQGNDNNYYLNHLVNKENNKVGSVFIDYRQNINNAKQLNIFGHSSDYYDLPFNTLLNYVDREFYKNNKLAEITTNNKTYKYEIFGVKQTTNEEHLKFDFTTSSDFVKHLEVLQANNLYDTNVKVNSDDEILIIQTCANNKKGDLLIICLRKVGEK